LCATALLMLTSIVSARDLVTSGYWKAYVTDDGINCGMATKPDDNRSVHIKFSRGGTELFIQIFRSSWRFPSDGAMDNRKLTDVSGAGVVRGAGMSSRVYNTLLNAVTFNVDLGYTNRFLDDLSKADWMTIDFFEGNEPRWTVNLIGTHATARSFANCIINMGGLQPRPPEAATQPYQPRATQPYNPRSAEPLPTIPVPTIPVRPTPVQSPKKDDGSI
jgi:hypothetical protein